MLRNKEGTKLVISLEMPSPASAPRPSAPKPSRKELDPSCKKATPEEKVREALECIESGHDSEMEWILINIVFQALKQKKKLSPRGKNLLKMIKPVLAKYGYHDVSSEKQNKPATKD